MSFLFAWLIIGLTCGIVGRTYLTEALYIANMEWLIKQNSKHVKYPAFKNFLILYYTANIVCGLGSLWFFYEYRSLYLKDKAHKLNKDNNVHKGSK